MLSWPEGKGVESPQTKLIYFVSETVLVYNTGTRDLTCPLRYKERAMIEHAAAVAGSRCTPGASSVT